MSADFGAVGAATATPDDATGGVLANLCRESGWAFVERDGRLAVDIDVPGAFCQALVEARGYGVGVTVPVLDAGATTPRAAVCERALGTFLLRVCGIVRLARVAADIADGAASPRFEVVFETRPCGAELAHAFAALSVASRVAAREAAVLSSDETVAGPYLAEWERKEGGP